MPYFTSAAVLPTPNMDPFPWAVLISALIFHPRPKESRGTSHSSSPRGVFAFCRSSDPAGQKKQAPGLLTTFFAWACPLLVSWALKTLREDERRGHHGHLSLTLFSSVSLDETFSLANTKTSCSTGTRKRFHPKTFSNDLEFWELESKGPGRAKEKPWTTLFQIHKSR